MTKYLGIALLSLCMIAPEGATAQRARRGQATPVLHVDSTLAEVRRLYETYELEGAKTRLSSLEDQLRRRKQAIPSEIPVLAERVARAERLLPRVERVQIKRTHQTSIDQINEALRTFAPKVASMVRFGYVEGRLTSEYRSVLGNMALFAEQDPEDKKMNLGQMEVLAGAEREVTETAFSSAINSEETENFPYMMPDGITLIFAREASEGLGGYDLFLSRYHVGRGTYLEARPLGMPFNSPADDYLLAYDDAADETILVTNRDCPEGEVRLYALAGMPRALSSQVESSAELELMLDEMQGLARLTTTKPHSVDESSDGDEAHPARGRDLSIYGLPEVRSAEGTRLAEEAIRLKDRLDTALARQLRMRQSYRQSEENRRELTPALQALEIEIASLRTSYAELIKAVRNAEAQY